LRALPIALDAGVSQRFVIRRILDVGHIDIDHAVEQAQGLNGLVAAAVIHEWDAQTCRCGNGQRISSREMADLVVLAEDAGHVA
jgi:hypothetical protein